MASVTTAARATNAPWPRVSVNAEPAPYDQPCSSRRSSLSREVNDPPSAVFTRSSSGALGSAAATPSRTTAITDCGASGLSTRTSRGGDARSVTRASGSAGFAGAFQPPERGLDERREVGPGHVAGHHQRRPVRPVVGRIERLHRRQVHLRRGRERGRPRGARRASPGRRAPRSITTRATAAGSCARFARSFLHRRGDTLPLVRVEAGPRHHVTENLEGRPEVLLQHRERDRAPVGAGPRAERGSEIVDRGGEAGPRSARRRPRRACPR